MERYLEEKYGKSARGAGADALHDALDEDDIDDIGQQSLQPSPKDPNLWLIRCRMGEEKHAAFLLMRKYVAYQKTDSVRSFYYLALSRIDQSLFNHACSHYKSNLSS